MRTLERLFQSETGLSFGKWRQQLRLLYALRLLAAGRPVTAVAFDVGYESASAFIAMFKRTLGVTPHRYFASNLNGGVESAAAQRTKSPRTSQRLAFGGLLSGAAARLMR